MVLRKLIAYYLKNMSGPLIVNLLGDGARTNLYSYCENGLLLSVYPCICSASPPKPLDGLTSNFLRRCPQHLRLNWQTFHHDLISPSFIFLVFSIIFCINASIGGYRIDVRSVYFRTLHRLDIILMLVYAVWI